MLDTLSKLLPIFCYFAIGLLIKRQGIAERHHGEFLLRLVLFVTLPMLILLTIAKTPITSDRLLLPLANILVNLSCIVATLLFSRLKSLPRITTGTLLVSTMIVNNAFMFPFILAIYGEHGLADAILFDFGNAVMMATVAYATAFHYSAGGHGQGTMLFKILRSPIVLALFISVSMSVLNIAMPAGLTAILSPVANMTSPLLVISLGILFSLRINQLHTVLSAVLIRMLGGLLFGLATATVLGFDGQTYTIVILCASAPVGFMAITYASLAKLDLELASNLVSLSLLVGMILTPLLILIFGQLN
jgi:predicted permease